MAEFWRNVALVAFTAPFIEPLLAENSALDASRAAAGVGVALAVLTGAIILDHERSE